MRGAIVDLDRSSRVRPENPSDRLAIVTLAAGCLLFALAVALAAPVAPAQPAAVDVPPSFVQRGIVLQPLRLPPGYTSVDLAALPERLANEAAPGTLRVIVSVRGRPGLAAAEGPAVVEWSEGGVVYSLRSSDRTTDELIRIAEALR